MVCAMTTELHALKVEEKKESINEVLVKRGSNSPHVERGTVELKTRITEQAVAKSQHLLL